MPDNFSERYGPWAVVAGASDGIGASVARLLGARGVNVVLVARRSATLEELDGIADPDDVARDMLDNLGNGPTFPPDPTPFSAVPRRQAVELMSRGSAVINSG